MLNLRVYNTSAYYAHYLEYTYEPVLDITACVLVLSLLCCPTRSLSVYWAHYAAHHASCLRVTMLPVSPALGASVGAAAVVTRNIPPRSVVVGTNNILKETSTGPPKARL